jgi:hypothetical protein
MVESNKRIIASPATVLSKVLGGVKLIFGKGGLYLKLSTDTSMAGVAARSGPKGGRNN